MPQRKNASSPKSTRERIKDPQGKPATPDKPSVPRDTHPKALTLTRWWTGLLLGVFTLHNIEELAYHDAGSGSINTTKIMQQWGDIYQPDRFIVAVIILTIILTAFLIPATIPQTSKTARLALVATGALIGNSITHIAQAAIFQSYNPGLITAIILLLPAAAQLARLLHKQANVSRLAATGLLVGGAFAAVPVIMMSLLLAKTIVG